jgi:hypothetical protein
LKIVWPNIILHQKDKTFWKREWYKHGTYSILDIFDYFHLTINLYYAHNLTSILERKGIIAGAYYSLRRISNAIKGDIGVKPRLVCEFYYSIGEPRIGLPVPVHGTLRIGCYNS